MVHSPAQIFSGRHFKGSLMLGPPPKAWPSHPWKVLVHTVNSPEGKESHDAQGHQQLDQQDSIDLEVGGDAAQLGKPCLGPGRLRETQLPGDSI